MSRASAWILSALCAAPSAAWAGQPPVASAAHAPAVNFETGVVRGLALSPDGEFLYALDTADDRLEVYRTFAPASFDARAPRRGDAPATQPRLSYVGDVFTGLEPASLIVHPQDADLLFVANHVSDTVSVVSASKRQVIATINVGDEPQGMAIADGKLFVACARAPRTPPALGQLDPGPFDQNVVVVVSASAPYAWLANVPIGALEPRDVVAVGGIVYAIAQNSGNHTTLLDEVAANQIGLFQEVPDAHDLDFAINPILTLAALNESGLARGWYIPSAGRIVNDSEYPALTRQLADRDVVPIDAHTLAPLTSVTTGVGTTLYAIERNPATGDLWVANTDAHNRTRFESKLKGAAIDNRVTIVAPGGGVKRVVSLAPPTSQAAHATPVAIAFARGLAYVAALSTSSIVVLDAADAAVVGEIATGPLPSALAADAARGLLYVLCRGDHTLRSYDLARGLAPLSVRALAYDPEPPSVARGRMHLYDARAATGHGNDTMACASCHVFGHDDQLGWDLGDSGGSLSYYFPDVMVGLAGYPGQIVVLPTTPILNPLKGPMVTQSLRGLLDPTPDTLPLHWRGDRRTLHTFRGAFANLLDGQELGKRDMQDFGAFLRSLEYPPNPFEPKDRQYAGLVAQGADKFGMNPAFEGKEIAEGTGVSCIDCHKGNFFDGSNYTGTRPTASGGAFTQIFNTGQTRLIYEKDFRDLAGFGLLHDGAVDGIRGFMDFVKPDSGLPVFPNFTTEDKDQIATFVKHWDTGLSPLVGAQATLDRQHVSQVDAFLDLAEQQARPPAAAVDLILHGFRIAPDGTLLPRGGLYQQDPHSGTWGYQIDTGDFVDRSVLEMVAQSGAATFTFTCVPPGLGVRLGLDRDEDGLFDAIERTLGTRPEDPDTDGDGYTDGDEVARGGDPLRYDILLPDSVPPVLGSVRALDVFVDVATIAFGASEPVTASVRLGTSPGAGDLGTSASERLARLHEVSVEGLPARTTVYYTVDARDRNGNAATASGSFRTFPPFLHVTEVTLEKSGHGPYTVRARVGVVDHEGRPVANVPLRGLFSGDIGGQQWQLEARTDASGVATLDLQPFTPVQPTVVGFSPAYLGSASPSDPYFVGAGGDTPGFYYEQSMNRAHYATLTVP